MAIQKIKEKVAHAKNSLTIKFHAVVTALGGFMSELPDLCNAIITNAQSVVGQVQTIADPQMIALIGKVIGGIGLLTIFIRAFHNSKKGGDSNG